MKISCFEISSFRRLVNTRVIVGEKNTVFVGANNSGKTSAIIAIQNFLIERKRDRFRLEDFTLSYLPKLDALGTLWEEESKASNPDVFLKFCPFLDVWLDVPVSEAYRVRSIIPTLDWAGGLIGIRLRLEPRDLKLLRHNYLSARAVVTELQSTLQSSKPTTETDDLPLWPRNLTEFLRRNFSGRFKVKTYILDPKEHSASTRCRSIDEKTSDTLVEVEGEPLTGLIRIDEISAQRGFGMEGSSEENDSVSASKKLSSLMSKYWATHLNPSQNPGVEDVGAIQAMNDAQMAFGRTISEGLSSAIGEIETMGYPGVANPQLEIDVKIEPMDGLNHDAALQYVVEIKNGDTVSRLKLPENSNGLGYQNLVFMVFKLISFRDSWMRKGKASSVLEGLVEPEIPLLHLVLIEEPEAYLHTQVQQVFIRQAYQVLRDHEDLKDSTKYSSQLILSTHSSHIAQECDFRELRYFRRIPSVPDSIPTSEVVNLSTVFGVESETTRFVTRYIKVTHCDILFADAAVLLEGSAERLLLPFFIGNTPALKPLGQFYISWVEIAGSHAHRLRPLIETLGITTLAVCDLDCKDGDNKKVWPVRGKGYTTRNQTLKTWAPAQEKIDDLLDAGEEQKVLQGESPKFEFRAAYQSAFSIKFGDEEGEVLFNTLEDALVIENLDVIEAHDYTGTWKKYKETIASATSISELSEKIYNVTRDAGKAEFALNLLELKSPEKLSPPTYILEGLMWLASKMKIERDSMFPVLPPSLELSKSVDKVEEAQS